MQILEPPSTESYKTEEGHFIKTFLISTKRNDADWQISKETGHEKVKTFVGKPFVIIPDELSSERQKGHVFADTKEALQEEYKKHTHGIIESISSPYYYADGTDDYFYMANIKLSGSKAAAALMESGANTWIPFAVSPHIWANDGNEPHADWEGISLSLVPQGAYGKDAVVTKYCKGEKHSCSHSLAASGPTKSLAAGTPRQQPVPLTPEQLSDMHAAMRVQTEDRMEADISTQLYRDPVERDSLFDSGNTVSGTRYTTVSPETTTQRISVAQEDPRGFLSTALSNSQQPVAPVTRVDVGGVAMDVQPTTMRDDFRELVTSDLVAQETALSARFESGELTHTFAPDTINESGFLVAGGPTGATAEQIALRGAINARIGQVDMTYNGVITEIQTDINNEAIDLNSEGQLVSDRFGGQSASEAMAAGEYGQTNGGIVGVTDSDVAHVAGGGGAEGGSGECCIFNQYGGGGCGPCK